MNKNIGLIVDEEEQKILDELKEILKEKTRTKVIRRLIRIAEKKYL